jgi:SAM-dependent methyltransferase
LDKKFLLPEKAERIILLQRINLATIFQKKIRKFFGRYFFSNFVTRFLVNRDHIASAYYKTMMHEFQTIRKFIEDKDTLFLSIGSGIGGLEAIINQNLNKKSFYFIERNYISRKVKYGWEGKNNTEAYNNFELQSSFLKMNGINKDNFYLFEYNYDELPTKKFDIITSLFSLDYHYDFNLYIDYLKRVSTDDTKIIFDTVRADYFFNIFKNVKIIKTDHDTVHKSKRILCSCFIR